MNVSVWNWLPAEIKQNILLDKKLDNCDIINYGRVSKEAYSLTLNEEFLKRLFPLEFVPANQINRNFILNFTITSENELITRVKSIVARLPSNHDLDIQASYFFSSHSPYILRLVNDELFCNEFDFPWDSRRNGIVKFVSSMMFNSRNLYEFFAKLSILEPKKPAFRFQICGGTIKKHNYNFLFRKSFVPKRFDTGLVKYYRSSNDLNFAVLKNSTMSFRSEIFLNYFNRSSTPQIYFSNSDAVEFEECLTLIFGKILSTFTKFRFDEMKNFNELKVNCDLLTEEFGDITKYPIHENDIRAVIKDPVIGKRVWKMMARMGFISNSIRTLREQDSCIQPSKECLDLIKASLGRVAREKEYRISEEIAFTIFLLMSGALMSTTES